MKTEGWEKRLSEFLRERRDMPFEWYNNDCMSFAAEAVKVMTGVDYFKGFNGYKDEKTAVELLRRNGGVSGIVTKCLGQPHRDYRKAKRGDIVIVRAPTDAGGVVDDTGQRIAVVTFEGLKRLPLNRAVKVWGI